MHKIINAAVILLSKPDRTKDTMQLNHNIQNSSQNSDLVCSDFLCFGFHFGKLDTLIVTQES